MISRVSLHDHIQNREFMNGVDYKKVIRNVARRLGDNGVWGVIDWGDGRADRFIDGLKAREKKFYPSSNGSLFYMPHAIHDFSSIPLWIVKGQEVPTKLGDREVHILSIGIPQGKKLPGHQPIQDTLKRAYETYGAIQIFDHPADPHTGIMRSLEKNPDLLPELLSIEGVSGWECYNSLSASAWNPSNAWAFLTRKLDLTNKRAIDFYETNIRSQFPHIGVTEGPDGHHEFEVARAYIETDLPLISSSRCGGNFMKELRGGIVSNKEYSGRVAPSFAGYASHAAAIVWDHKILKPLGLR